MQQDRLINRIVCSLCLLLVIISVLACNANKASSTPGWEMHWSDEFDGATNSPLDKANWLYDTGTSYPNGPAHWGTGEVQSYSESTENVYQDGNGNLAIKAIHTGSAPTTGWSSGRIETVRSDFQPPAGKAMAVEARIQLPDVSGTAAQGYWPAFWMLGAPFRGNYWNWPGIGEFDILENINGQNTWYGTLHCGVNPGGPCRETNGIGANASAISPTLQSAYHVYRFEFDKSVTPQQLRWYVDGVQRHTVNANQMDATTWDNATNHGFFILLNLAIGGGWPGAPTNKTASGKVMLVDYVRVYYSR
ncbi:MAG: glycoside hydrolase family 16 protein [Caldilineaceae bacterium]